MTMDIFWKISLFSQINTSFIDGLAANVALFVIYKGFVESEF